MHRAQRQWYAGYISLYYNKEQKEYNSEIGRKQRMRGYNQSECVAKGVAAVTGIPLDAASVVRKKHTETQTSKSAYERWKNVNGIFHLRYPERFVGKHILLVDDVLTTGATITTCADVFRDVEGVRISVLTLAVANF